SPEPAPGRNPRRGSDRGQRRACPNRYRRGAHEGPRLRPCRCAWGRLRRATRLRRCFGAWTKDACFWGEAHQHVCARALRKSRSRSGEWCGWQSNGHVPHWAESSEGGIMLSKRTIQKAALSLVAIGALLPVTVASAANTATIPISR